MTDEALHKILLDQMAEMRAEHKASRELMKKEHGEVMCELRGLAAGQSRLVERADACAAWRMKHEKDHGLVVEVRPSVWVSNSTAWAWHHPKRTAAAMMLLLAILFPPVRSWMVEKATWGISLWLAG